MRTVRSRTLTFMVGSTVIAFTFIALAVFTVTQDATSITRNDATAQATNGVDLLATLGAQMSILTPDRLGDVLTPAESKQLNSAVKEGQREKLLAGLTIWDRSGLIVYSSVKGMSGKIATSDAELRAAFSGHPLTRTYPHEIDPITGKRTGLVESIEPLLDKQGRIYGAVQATKSLSVINAEVARTRLDSLLIVLTGAALVLLILAPLWVRLARSQARQWIPGRRKTLRGVRSALDHDQIELVYQPQVEPGSRRVAAVEALVRWRRHGILVAPDSFFPAVESAPLMARLTDRVLDLAIAQLAAWQRTGLLERVSVNLSATDLIDQDLPARIASKLAANGIAGHDLTLEITETAFIEECALTNGALIALHAQGIDIALDDFGTGHASIERLHALPYFSEVKIDRSYVSETAPRTRTYLKAMLSFAQALGLRVIVEGVEDSDTLTFLDSTGCDLAQGYFISRPLETEAMTSWLSTAQAVEDDPIEGASAESMPVEDTSALTRKSRCYHSQDGFPRRTCPPVSAKAI